MNNQSNFFDKLDRAGTILQIILIVAVIAIFLASCRTCPPAAQITNGRALQKWEGHHRAGSRTGRYSGQIRVMWIHWEGPFAKVRYANMQRVINKIYLRCLPPGVQQEAWVNIDSI